MKAVRLQRLDDPTSFVCEDVPEPEPEAGEVVVRVHAAAVTPTERDWLPTSTTRAGQPRPFPIILGHEFSGVIHAIGSGVTDLAVGEAVFGMNDWFRDGAQAEYCVARTADVAAKPRTIDHVAAAATPISALTAWQGLIERARLSTGQRVLIHGAAGGIGIFAVQLARLREAHVVATASGHNLDFVRGLGAHEVIDYRASRFEEGTGKFDVVFDTVGGETLNRSWSVLEPGGILVTVAASSERTRVPRERDAFFIVEANRAQLEEVARLIDSGALRVVVGAVFPLADGRAAYESRPQHGKIVLLVRE